MTLLPAGFRGAARSDAWPGSPAPGTPVTVPRARGRVPGPGPLGFGGTLPLVASSQEVRGMNVFQVVRV